MKPVSSDTRKRWKWLLVPVAYAAFTFISLAGMIWWNTPAESGSLSFSLPPGALGWMSREVLFKWAVVLVPTVLALPILPRIDLRHVAYLALAALIVGIATDAVAIHLGNTVRTNGEQVMSILLTYGAGVLAGALVIRANLRRANIHEG